MGNLRVERLEHPPHVVLRLAYAESSDSDPIPVSEIEERPKVLEAKVLVDVPLKDREKALGSTRSVLFEELETLPAPGQPLERAPVRRLGLLASDAPRCALVERHHDIGSQRPLDVHHSLGCEEMTGPVDVAPEDHTVVPDLVAVCEREDLVAARVGEDRPIPAHEFVDSAQLLDQFMPRTQVKVVGVGEDHGRSGALDLLGRNAFDGAAGAHGHEDGRLHLSVGCGKRAGAGGTVGGVEVEVEHAWEAPCSVAPLSARYDNSVRSTEESWPSQAQVAAEDKQRKGNSG